MRVGGNVSRVLAAALAAGLVACAPTESDDGDDDADVGDDDDDDAGDDDDVDDVIDDDAECPADNAAPAAPSILSPNDGITDVIADELAILVADYADPDGDPQQD